MEEIWQPIPEYEGHYEASNYGNVRSIPKRINQKSRGGNWYSREYPGMVLAKSILNNGYEAVGLSKSGRMTGKLVHRLVLSAFEPNTENKRTVNHKNGIRNDNNIGNLEWATTSENISHSYRELGRRAPMQGMTGIAHHASKPVIQKNQDGSIARQWDAAMDAVRCGFDSSCISRCCNGASKSHKGYIWEYGSQ